MIKLIKEETVEVKRVEIELELTYIDGVLQDATKSFTIKEIEDLLAPEVEEEPEEEVTTTSTLY